MKEHFSYSQYSLFKSSPVWYFKRYFKGITYDAGFEFGKKVANKLEHDEGDSIELNLLDAFIKKYPVMNYEIECDFEGIKLKGAFDGFDEEKLHLGEYKTGDIRFPWTQKKADHHIQITWYYLMLYMRDKKIIQRATLHYIPVKRVKSPSGVLLKEEIVFEKLRDFETKRNLGDIAKLGVDIKRVWKQINEMSDFYLINGYVIINGKRYE
ncbi:MAG: hypothetical protein XE08_0325 [Parcubacteria bacterium 32_520]|nr:MAG: hypothetical protein XE08_0325 [Parcubacteria bacterium 32_520]